MKGKRRWLFFFAGVFTGMLVLAVVAAGLVYLGSSRTWLLRINTNGIAAKIEGAAQLKISQMLPGYIESVKGSVPELVANRAANQFSDLKFTLGGEEFALPQEFVSRLEANYRASLIRAINDLLDTMPVEKMSAELGKEIADIVENSLYAEFNSREVDVGVFRDKISIPVMIELVNQPGHRDFQLILMSNEVLEQ